MHAVKHVMTGADEMPVDVQIAVENSNLPSKTDLRCWANCTLSSAEVKGWSDSAVTQRSLCIRVVDETEGREANRAYRGKDYATNVLSFSADNSLLDLPLEAVPLGDLLICAPVVVGEAQQQGKPVSDHFAHLVVHGLLHLLGYDHEDKQAAIDMESKEVLILADLGVPHPYG